MKFCFILLLMVCRLLLAQTSLAVITSFKGTVHIKHSDGSTIEASLLSDLFAGDTVLTSVDGEATLFFHNGTLLSLGTSTCVFISDPDFGITQSMANEDPQGIGDEFSSLFKVGAAAEKVTPKMVLRVPEDSVPLHVYQPGNTSLLTPTPDIVWGSYPNANWYRLTLQQMSETIISIATTDTVWTYSHEHDTLTPGAYLLRVSARLNDEILRETERFVKICNEDEVTKVLETIKQISQQKPDTFTQHLLLALLYERYSLRLDAAEAYKALLELNENIPFIYKTLAHLYQTMGMPEIANRYLDTYETLTNE